MRLTCGRRSGGEAAGNGIPSRSEEKDAIRGVVPGTVRGVVLAAAIGLFLAHPSPCRADGGFFSSIYADIYEPEQTALLVYDATAGREDLFLSVAFEGDAADFGWVVPVPALPEVAAVDPRLFWECAMLTEPLYRDRGLGCATGTDDRAGSPEVSIYDDRQVGIYHSLVVGSNDAGALTDSLTRWGFLHDGNRSDTEAALRFYTDRGWFFALFRIDPEQRPGSGGRWSGRLDPVRLSFPSEHPVYPLRISAVSATEWSGLLLYVCADHRMTFPGASTEYVNRLSSGELGAIRERHPRLGPLLSEGRYLTKLRRGFTPAEMSDDLVLAPAPTDDELRLVHYSSVPVTGLLLLGLMIGWWGRWVSIRRGSKRAR